VWSISTSETDPLESVGPIPEDGWLYLWAARVDELQAGEFRLTGSLIPIDFEPLSGVAVIPGTFPDLLFHLPECQTGPFLAGRIRVEDPTSVDAFTWGKTKALYR
jgi:hypothetical protein